MRRFFTVLAAAALLVFFGRTVSAEEETGTNAEGYIKTWLLLAPIPMDDGQSGADALDKQQVPNEAKLQPKAGDKTKAGGKELEWKKYQAKEDFLDFNDFLGKQIEDSVGYAVCYVAVPEEMKGAQLKIGSDDQCKVYLNGKEVHKFTEPRPLEKDQDTVEVTLQKGVNVFVFKIVNEKVDWSGSARFLDKDGKPVKSLKATTTPPGGEEKK
jgi:hypothetical protein